MIFATLINTAAIILGGSIGLILKGKVSERISKNVVCVLGLCVCIIGISNALGGDFVLLVISLALGTLAGELLNIDKGLTNLGEWLKKKLKRDEENSDFNQGFIVATLLFCVGAMAIVGSIESGLRGDMSIIITKSIIDFVCAMLLASTFGIGVLLSAVVIFFYQGSIEFFAGYMQNILTDGLITQISAVGGIMIFGLGLNMAINAKIKVANLLPGFIFGIAYYFIFI